MNSDTPRTIVTRMIERGMLEGDLDAAVTAYVPDFVYHNPVIAEMPGLPAGEEDRVSVLYSWTGTHTGTVGGIPATGRRVRAPVASFCRVQARRILEQWDIDDRMGVMQQLGVVTGAQRQV